MIMEENNNIDVMYFHGETVDGCRYTISGIIEEDGDLVMGAAICSEHDQFNKEIGRTISTGRLLNQRHFPRGRNLRSLYGSDLRLNWSLELEAKGNLGWKKDYFKGREIQVFRAYVTNFNYFTKKELQNEFRLFKTTS